MSNLASNLFPRCTECFTFYPRTHTSCIDRGLLFWAAAPDDEYTNVKDLSYISYYLYHIIFDKKLPGMYFVEYTEYYRWYYFVEHDMIQIV